ncbi:MAG: DUF5615 family PIN-like protein [Rhodanobacteraceae bacterium]
MKLLLDENLSLRMLADLEGVFPGSNQVVKLGFETAGDAAIWTYAREHGYALVTKDSDFHELATLYGSPPKIIWIKCGNRPRWYITNLLLKHRDEIVTFGEDDVADVAEIL